jgi:hypothetical protein
MARFPSGKVISVLNHLVSEEVFLGFSTNFFSQSSPGWIPQVKIDLPKYVGQATLNDAIEQIHTAAGCEEGDIVLTFRRWDE